MHSEIDRSDAEAALRIALWPPMTVIAIYLAATVSVVWLAALLLPLTLARQAIALQRRSDDQLVTAIVAKPELQSFVTDEVSRVCTDTNEAEQPGTTAPNGAPGS